MSEIVAGGVVALLAFMLAAVWDLFKFRRDRRARQIAALVGFTHEMRANYVAAENNLNLLGVEQHDIETGEIKALLNPLSALETGAWTVARLDLPASLLDEQSLVRRLQIINRNTADINGLIQSRENFRIQHLGSDEMLVDGLKKYADVLIHMLRDLKDRIDESQHEVESWLPNTAEWRRGLTITVTVDFRARPRPGRGR